MERFMDKGGFKGGWLTIQALKFLSGGAESARGADA
jgi:hypothetical protein